MPVVDSRNNRILPANSRAVDVAKRAIQDIAPVQQRRYDNAFKVQSYQVLLYSRLNSGPACSCGAKRKAINTRLGKDGKLDSGAINEMLSGGFHFGFTPYAASGTNTPAWKTEQGIADEARENRPFTAIKDEDAAPPDFKRLGHEDDGSTHVVVDPETDQFGVNGPVINHDQIEALDNDFDEEHFSDTACAICMGTGFVSGFALNGGWRKVFVPQMSDVVYDGIIDMSGRPIVVRGCTSVQFNVVLPYGAWLLDSLTVWNETRKLNASFLIDSTPVTEEYEFLAYCDGQQHSINAVFPQKTDFTHLEIQVATSTEPDRIDFPKLSQGTDLTKLDHTDDIQVCASPVIPLIKGQDVFVESSFGRAFMVKDVTSWNEDTRKLLGWDFSARVIQPHELLNLLPRRRVQKQLTTNMVRQNSRGDSLT